MHELPSILHHIPPALLVVFRISGLMIYGPIFGSSVIPGRVRIFLSFLVGLAAYPLLSSRELAGVELQLNLWTLAPLMAMEVLIGLVIGYLASLPLLAMQTAGLMMGQQMGLGFAQMFNPAIEDESDVVSQLLVFLALAGFLALGGHEWMLMAVLHSFQHIPLGGFAVDLDLINLVGGLVLSSLELALRVAAPVLAMVFLETVAMGFLAKTVPQLNILSLGFPIRILVGLTVIALGLVVIHDVSTDWTLETFNAVAGWIQAWDAK